MHQESRGQAAGAGEAAAFGDLPGGQAGAVEQPPRLLDPQPGEEPMRRLTGGTGLHGVPIPGRRHHRDPVGALPPRVGPGWSSGPAGRAGAGGDGGRRPDRHDWRIVDAALDRLECPRCHNPLRPGPRRLRAVRSGRRLPLRGDRDRQARRDLGQRTRHPRQRRRRPPPARGLRPRTPGPPHGPARPADRIYAHHRAGTASRCPGRGPPAPCTLAGGGGPEGISRTPVPMVPGYSSCVRAAPHKIQNQSRFFDGWRVDVRAGR